MVKKGFTLIELLIAMSILGIILAVTSSIFGAAIRNYQISISQSTLQRNVNFVTDDISRNIKIAVEFPESHGTHIRDHNTLILALPAINQNQEFIYSGAMLEKDHIIYEFQNNNIKKTTIANPLSARFQEDISSRTVLPDVHSLSFQYNDPLFTQVKTEILTKKTVSKTEIKISGESTAVRRNN